MEKYPEHEKLRAVKPQSQVIGEFLDQLGYLGFELGKWEDRPDWCDKAEFVPANEPIQSILSRYFEIDQKKLEEEKLQMIEEQRELNSKHA